MSNTRIQNGVRKEEKMAKKIPSDEELKKYINKKMTMPLLEHASEEARESVWNSLYSQDL